MGLSPHLPFQYQFHCPLFKTSECSEYFVTEQKAMLSLKITFGGDFDPSFSSFRDLFTVFKFLMFNKVNIKKTVDITEIFMIKTFTLKDRSIGVN